MATVNDEVLAKNEIYTYESPWPVYALNWSTRNEYRSKYRLAVGSFRDDLENYVQVRNRLTIKIIQLDEEQDKYVLKDQVIHTYPATKIMWKPDKDSSCPDIFASTSDYLYIWNVDVNGKAAMRAVLDGSSASAPITSFDWNETETNIIATSSIDTTCTIWDIDAEKIVTQLIAHDKEVNDIAFSNQKNIFTTVGADGSLRIFDLRNLEHSTVLYENDSSIVRVGWHKQDLCYIAAVMYDSPKTILMDVRMPTRTVIDLVGHSQAVNAISFAPHTISHICTAGEDSKALIWNLSRLTHPMDPVLCYQSEFPINSLHWSIAQPDWIAVAFDTKVQVLRV